MKVLILSTFLVSLCNYSLTLPGPRVYVVTPSPKAHVDEGRSAPQPFYYQNWMRRMDSPSNSTTSTTTTTTPRVKTPDLIFAEFESDHMKNIRKLLDRERIASKTTTTSTTVKPIYVSEESMQEAVNYGVPFSKPVEEDVSKNEKDMTDYFAAYNNMYNNDNALPAPVYLPSTTTRKATTTTTKPTTVTSTTREPVNNVENIWHIIDSEKQNQYSEQWDEIPIGSESDQNREKEQQTSEQKNNADTDKDDSGKLDENFALPGFGTNPGNGGENESRAIRTEPNIRFPYVNLKPFQIKNSKKPLLDVFSNSKKGNMFTSLDNFMEVKNPVRGEVEDTASPMQHQIDRYNPAQPYLPSIPGYGGGKSKQSSPISAPVKTVANLVPPPPPLPPKITDNNFPLPSTYERFPPFASDSDTGPPAPPVALPQPPTPNRPPMVTSEADDSDGPKMDLGYRYKPPSAPTSKFLPTLPPLQKPFGGYSYDKPTMTAEAPPTDMDDNDQPDFQGYSYDKPAPAVPDIQGYHYSKPEPPSPPKDHGPSYDHAPSYGPSYDHHPHGSDYPELIFDKPHGGMKGGDDVKADDMGMVPPPMSDMKPGMDAPGPPIDDSGFPHDFPGEFKYHHDFDHDFDHDFYHHHHHHPTTTTTTTEMPRVNRYSYYYLGKKLYYLPLYFSVYFIVYVGALIIKAILRHKIVYPNSWRPNDYTSTFFSKRSIDALESHENLHEITRRVTRAIASAAEKYMENKKEK